MKYKLKDIGTIITGTTPKTKNKDYYNSKDFLFVGPTDLKIGKYVRESEKYVSLKAYNDYSSRFIGKNSLMIDCIGSDMGNVALSVDKVLTNQQINSITDINENNFNVEFLYYLFSTMKKYFHQIGTNGSTMPIINKTMFEEIEVEIPNKVIQDKIAYILSKIDMKIDCNIHTNNNLYEIGLSLIEEEYNSINKTEKLQNIIQFTKGKKPVKIVKYKDKNYDKYLTIACLNYQELNYANKEKMIIAQNDILMVMDGASSGEVYYSDSGIVGSTFARINIINKTFTKEYMFFILKKYTDLIKTKNTGSAIPHADKAFINLLSVPRLSIENQKKYCIILKKIQQNEHKIRNLMIIRDTLLPKLMNDEIDLDKIEI